MTDGQCSQRRPQVDEELSDFREVATLIVHAVRAFYENRVDEQEMDGNETTEVPEKKRAGHQYHPATDHGDLADVE